MKNSWNAIKWIDGENRQCPEQKKLENKFDNSAMSSKLLSRPENKTEGMQGRDASLKQRPSKAVQPQHRTLHHQDDTATNTKPFVVYANIIEINELWNANTDSAYSYSQQSPIACIDKMADIRTGCFAYSQGGDISGVLAGVESIAKLTDTLR